MKTNYPIEAKVKRFNLALARWKPYNDALKKEFHLAARNLLKHYAKDVLQLPADTYDLRTNRAGIAVSGETTLHGESVYIQASVPCVIYAAGVTLVRPFLVRSCNGRKDYHGGENHFMTAEQLIEAASVITQWLTD